jgi:hypothetical protein
MSKRQKGNFLLEGFEQACEEYFNEFGKGPKAFFLGMLHGDAMDRRAMLPLMAKLIPAATPEKPDEGGKVIDFPWLTRERLAYKDPARRASLEIEDAVIRAAK